MSNYTNHILGLLKSIEGVDIKSEKFEITDEKIFFCFNGDVEIDFPDGILKSNKVKLDRDQMDYSNLKKMEQFIP